MSSKVTLLGHQRHVPMVRQAVETWVADPRAPVAVVTAGWEERENEDQELREHLARPCRNLAIWNRIEKLFQLDPDLLEAMRWRHDRLRRVQELYRLRLAGLMAAARQLLAASGDETLLQPERDGAILMLHALDREHELRVTEVHDEFRARWRPDERKGVIVQRAELERELDGCAAVCVAGGHIGVLLHRLRLFDFLDLIGERPVVAWSAGAMALSSRIVLFHDDPPQGGADAELMERGLGAFQGVIALPHASRRLRLDDRGNVALLARRFAPDLLAALDEGTRLDLHNGRWRPAAPTRALRADGSLGEVAA